MAGIAETRTWDSLLTTTFAKYSKDIQDQIFDNNPALAFFSGKLPSKLYKGKKVKKVHDGGESIVKPLLYEANKTVSSYSGADTLDTSPQEGHTIARFDWKNYAGTVTITGEERRKNSGEGQFIELLEAKKEQLVLSMKDELSVDIFGDGTGNGGKALTGLAALISASTTVGGLSPTTYTWWKPYNNTSVGSFAAGGMAAIRTAINSLNFGGTDKPSIAFTTQTIWEYIETAEDEKVRHSVKELLDLGYENIAIKTTPFLFDRDCTPGAIYLLNSNYINMDVHQDADMKMTPFETTISQDITSAKMLFMANLTVSNRRKHGILSGITA